ncbi:hypothetical protein MMC25_002677 [Agyrium rufum]|nr:hypothetical protein [Agyrium rufum]
MKGNVEEEIRDNPGRFSEYITIRFAERHHIKDLKKLFDDTERVERDISWPEPTTFTAWEHLFGLNKDFNLPCLIATVPDWHHGHKKIVAFQIFYVDVHQRLLCIIVVGRQTASIDLLFALGETMLYHLDLQVKRPKTQSHIRNKTLDVLWPEPKLVNPVPRIINCQYRGQGNPRVEREKMSKGGCVISGEERSLEIAREH